MRSEPEEDQAEPCNHRPPNDHFAAAKLVKEKTKDRLGHRGRKSQNGSQQTGGSEGDLKLVNQKREKGRKKRRIKVDHEVTQGQIHRFGERLLSLSLAHRFSSLPICVQNKRGRLSR